MPKSLACGSGLVSDIGKGKGYHRIEYCRDGDYPCAVHSPSIGNRMRGWPFVIRLDKYGIMERTCAHGVGHPDSDSLDWLHRHYDDRIGKRNVEALGIHGCDGCCFRDEILI